MRQITLNDGTVLQDSYVIQDGNILWVYIYAAISFEDAFLLLCNPDNVKKVTLEQFGEKTVFKGFTELFCIRKEDGGFISAGVRK